MVLGVRKPRAPGRGAGRTRHRPSIDTQGAPSAVEGQNLRGQAWFVGPDGTGEPKPFGPDGGDRWGAAFSPDGALLAYTSMESGVAEVFLETLSPDGGRWQVSSEGGMFPLWSRDGRELVFVCGDTMMAVEIEVSPTIHIGLPVPLFKSPFELRTPPVRSFDMLPDGRLVMVGRVDDGADRPEICVLSSSTPA